MTSIEPLPGDLRWTETRSAAGSVVSFEGPAPSSMLAYLGWPLIVVGICVAAILSFTKNDSPNARYAPLAPLGFFGGGVLLVAKSWPGGPAAGRIEADASRLKIVPAGLMSVWPREIAVGDVEHFRASEELTEYETHSDIMSSSVGADRWYPTVAVVQGGERVVVAAFKDRRNAELMVVQMTALLEHVRALKTRP